MTYKDTILNGKKSLTDQNFMRICQMGYDLERSDDEIQPIKCIGMKIKKDDLGEETEYFYDDEEDDILNEDQKN